MSTILTQTNDPILLMSSPDFYAIREPDAYTGSANDFEVFGYREQQKDPKSFREAAIKQWLDLRRVFNALGVKTIDIEPVEDMPDIVFTADPSLSLVIPKMEALNADPRVITMFSRFSNEERQEEVRLNMDLIERQFPDRALVHSHFRTEGTGDNVYDSFRDVFWSGFTENVGRMNAASGRSDIRAHKTLTDLTGVPVNSMAVKKPFFHIDTSMAPLTNGHIICFKDGMQPEAYDTLLREGFDRYGMPRDEYLIEVSAADAEIYACNLRCVGDTIIMPRCSNDLKDRLMSKGYDVITLDMSQFVYAGGAMHCLTNNLNERRIVGGTCVKKGFERLPAPEAP